MKQYPSITERTTTLFLNIALALGALWWATGRVLPSGGLESVWLISAISFWFFALLSAPWFVPPRDAIIGAVGALLVLTTMDLSRVAEFRDELEAMRWIFVGFSALIALMSVVALILHDNDGRSPAGRFAFRSTSIFGRGEILFSAPAIISIIGAYQASFTVMGWLLLFWTFVTVGRPVEKLAAAWRMLRDNADTAKDRPTVGVIDRIDHPNIVRVRLNSGGAWQSNRLFTASMPDGTQKFVVSLFSQVQGTEVVGTGLCVATVAEPIPVPRGVVCASHDDAMTSEFIGKLSGEAGTRLIGFVVENSTIGVISFEVASNAGLQEGDVVFARISGEDIFYQIIGAETVEESFDQNPRGTHVVRAAQLGIYSAKAGFTKYSWLPTMNSPLFSAQSRVFEAPVLGPKEFKIGNVPSTNVQVVARIEELVEYHTAVLGVTGTGKTELALDIVRESIATGVKAFCVDFTGDYRIRLADLKPIFPSPTNEQAVDLERKLFAVDTGEFGAKKEKKILQTAMDELRESTKDQINKFLESDEENLAVFELAEITNTKASLSVGPQRS
ncbi:DUF87 domain-containing protein [Aurantimonas sp. E1-2-R+4]|uniref:helicase HerA domain-containing protein n=1 Tax=Aurantimonas sp. E1-2-R+4 TaxID=3113714 RepID=UPI002F95D9F9